MHLIITGAYGRTYNSVKAIKADLVEGKDFMMLAPGYGCYVSLPEILKDSAIGSVEVRYGKRGEKVTCFYDKDFEKMRVAAQA